MKNKLLKRMLMLSRLLIYGVVAQFFLVTWLLANESTAQDYQSIREKTIDISVNEVSIREVFDFIESETDYKFFYDDEIIHGDVKLSLKKKNIQIADILLEVSRVGGLKFKQINQIINVNERSAGFADENPIEVVIQTRTITGKITSLEDDEGLPGVNVVLKGTTVGTVTDVDGNYTIDVPDATAVLVFSSVGFIREEIVVGTRTVIDMQMSPDIKALEEIVVIGYGVVEKSDLTGAVARVKKESFENQSTTQVIDLLAGTVAGLNIDQSTMADGGSRSLKVRGPTSLTGGTNPLIVLDGVIYNGSLRDINPNDIETVDVLKDASSAAVFGAKAASGVIIITTTKGRTGKPTINFTTKIGLSKVANDNFRPRNGEEYQDFRRDYYRTLGNGEPDWYWNHPDNLPEGVSIEQWRNASANPHPDNTYEYLNRLNFFDTEIEQYMAGNTVDWFNEIMQTGIRQEYDASISGGRQGFNHYWSVGYIDNEGIILGDHFSTVRTRLNVALDITDWFKVGVNSLFSSRDHSAVPASLRMERVSPYSKIFDDDGTMRWYPHDYAVAPNPLLNYHAQRKDKVATNVFASMFAEVALPLGIKYKVSFQPRYVFLRDYNFWGSETIVGGRDHIGGYGRRTDHWLYEWMIDNLLTWNKEIGIHKFDLTFLFNAEQVKSNYSNSINETFLPNEALGYHGLQFGTLPKVTSDDIEAGGDALMGRLNYTLADKYLFTVSLRRDGYSAFGQENPRATFPAAAFAWKISEEDFIVSDLIDRMKLRLSWGVNGNRDIGIYSALAQIENTLYYDGSNVQIGLYNRTLANSSLRWERTESFNIGLDIGLFNDRLDFSADYYDMITTDLLMNRQLPKITGFSNITTNLGELGNKGFELTVNTVNISASKFMWKSGVVFSMNRNKIKKLFGDYDEDGNELPDYSNHWFPGQAVDVIWNYDVVGVWQLDEADQAGVYNMKPGDYKAVDVNEDGLYEALVDKQFIGHHRPRYRLGFKNDIALLDNLSASVFIRADLGHIGYFIYATHSSSTYDRRSYWNIPYWTPTNGNNEYARTSEVHGAYEGGLRITKPRGFVRVQDVSLSYTLPKHVVQFMRVDNLRVFGSIRNLFTFTDWPGWDPESGNTPMPKIFTLGLDLSL